ncbi:hypothetical protein ACFFIS_01260 [Virgibacillus soli]|uniref:Uncharacterized protein n=1 Tax=Paracerasibacillus soli TaxID=480284 RepID=A0ABU5CPJ8_9BACI|nr:hypothetical protein [Virgibacillus soli]MDY0408288.1 hypothetical protein [Virgibacillus soli]
MGQLLKQIDSYATNGISKQKVEVILKSLYDQVQMMEQKTVLEFEHTIHAYYTTQQQTIASLHQQYASIKRQIL